MSLANTLPKLIATAIRISARKQIPRLHPAQRCLEGRSILENVLLIDSVAHLLSLRAARPLLILFDIIAAFPYLWHELLFCMLAYTGLPELLIHITVILYRNVAHTIRLAGKCFDGPTLLSGVRQGCPLSMLLLAICVDPLGRAPAKELHEDEAIGAFADEIGAAVDDYVLALPVLGAIFNCFASFSNLQLNFDKSIFVPLWQHHNTQDARQRIQEACPPWAGFPVLLSATYLGFTIGPEGFTKQWH